MKIRAHYAALLAVFLTLCWQPVAQARDRRHGYEDYPPRYSPRLSVMPSNRYYQGTWHSTRAVPSNKYFHGSWYNPYSDAGALPSAGSPYYYGW